MRFSIRKYGGLMACLCAGLALLVTIPVWSAPPARHGYDAPAMEQGDGADHGDPYVNVFKGLAAILACAVLGRFVARKLNQSPVLGELVAGILLGAALYQAGNETITLIRHGDLVNKITIMVRIGQSGWHESVHRIVAESGLSELAARNIEAAMFSPGYTEHLLMAKSLLLFSNLGVMLLLFMVGLEVRLSQMRAVGRYAAAVAVVGVLAPMLMGMGVALLLLPANLGWNAPLFVGATLCATSVGITARVFRDMYALQRTEARIVLGAAVLDDVLGLIILAIVSGIIAGGSVNFAAIGIIVLKAVLFLGAVVFFGTRLIRGHIAFFARLDRSNVKLIFPFGLLMALSWLSNSVGLASIVGAFAAGLIVKEECFQVSGADDPHPQSVESIIAPIEGIFAPVFFVLMGMQVDISAFGEAWVLLVGLSLSLVAVLGKLAAGLPIPRGLDRLVVGIGMVPRGEVGLIFAGIGKTLGVLDDRLFAVALIVVMTTTMVTPPLLKWALERKRADLPAT